jgi:hypothetical protein
MSLYDDEFGEPEPGGFQIGLRVLLAFVSYIGMTLACLGWLWPVHTMAQAIALALALGATLRPLYMLTRISLDSFWYEDWCLERAFLARHIEVSPEMDDLNFFKFCALCLSSSLLGAVMVLTLIFIGLCVAGIWALCFA